MELADEPGQGMCFVDNSEMNHALYSKAVTLHTKIKYRRKIKTITGEEAFILVDSTPGRIIVSELLEDTVIPFESINKLLTTKEITYLIDVVFRHCGQKQTVIFADRLMKLGFAYACKAGISIGKDDMLIPTTKEKHIKSTFAEVKEYEKQYADGLITMGEKYNKVVDIWSKCTDKVAGDLIQQISALHEREEGEEANQSRVNSIYMMAHSGARGSVTQIRQLAGMRGLMAKPSGEIIETPIISNLKEGLSVLEYFTSTHGARKGLADTALKTANSGYLTRRLVDVAMDCITQEFDCGTDRGIIVKAAIDGGEVTIPLAEKILGRVTSTDIYHPMTNELIVAKSEVITEDVVEKIDIAGIESLKIRSVLTCEAASGICSKCYGRDLATGDLVSTGEAVGVIAAQSIGEPGTQLTMRTFHIGGAATKGAEISNVEASYDGKIFLVNRNVVTDSEGRKVVMSRSCEILLADDKGIEKARFKIPYGAKLNVDEGDMVKKGARLAEWDPYTIPIITEKTGKIAYHDLIEGISMREVVDEATGIASKVVVDWKQQTRGADLRPRMMLLDEKDEIKILANGLEARYFLPINAILSVEDGAQVHAGDVIARIPRESSKTRDITGGLPKVAEIFEARKPKDHAVISEVEGYVEFGKDYKSKRRIIIKPADKSLEPIEYMIPRGKHVSVNEGDYIKKGDLLLDGNPVLHDILKVMGVEALAHYMVSEIQQVYRLQGVKIDDKHIEVIIRQMLQKVEIINPGETTLLAGEQIDKQELEEINQKAEKKGYIPAVAMPVLQGITKASLQTRSFISAASFQETTRVLTEAAVAGKFDKLQGFKENVIVGRLIPAGTGFYLNDVKRKAAIMDVENSLKEEALKETQLL